MKACYANRSLFGCVILQPQIIYAILMHGIVEQDNHSFRLKLMFKNYCIVYLKLKRVEKKFRRIVKQYNWVKADRNKP